MISMRMMDPDGADRDLEARQSDISKNGSSDLRDGEAASILYLLEDRSFYGPIRELIQEFLFTYDGDPQTFRFLVLGRRTVKIVIDQVADIRVERFREVAAL